MGVLREESVMTERASPRRKGDRDYRLEETTLDGKLESWPPEPPRAPRTPADAARLALIAAPGEVHRLSWSFSDVGRAAKLAQSFRRARPSRLDPRATGSFDARAFFDPSEHRWRVAARYLPGGEDSKPPEPAREG